LREVLEAGLGLVEQVVVPSLCGRETNCNVGSVASSGIKTARALLAGDFTAGVGHAFELLREAGDLGKSAAYSELKRFGSLFSEIADAKSGDESLCGDRRVDSCAP
jgi:hypothetical protein